MVRKGQVLSNHEIIAEVTKLKSRIQEPFNKLIKCLDENIDEILSLDKQHDYTSNALINRKNNLKKLNAFREKLELLWDYTIHNVPRG